ncbi:MAG: glycosyltransferase family 2 protein [Acidimicrobiia bacterium]|nr:glycosyltransferase family 2 protein [Acidimicrobiia bacterium]
MTSDSVLLSIVLPAYNEVASIEQALEQCARVAEQMPGPVEAIVVDDGSQDGTDVLVKQLMESRPWLRSVRHEQNQGYGRALRNGFAAARGEFVFYTDADNQFDITELLEHWPLLADADMLVGYRVYRYDPLPRLVASWIYNRIVRVLFRVKVRDVDCSFKLMRRNRLDSIVLSSDDFFIDTELVARGRKWNWRIKEVGVRHYPRRAGKTTVRPSDVPRTLFVIAKMWFHIHFPNRARHATTLTQQIDERRELRGD